MHVRNGRFPIRNKSLPNDTVEQLFHRVECHGRRKEAIADVRAYIAFYNSLRIHTTLGDLAPIKFEKCT
ncbi:IS3 family transposase [Microbulbifer sp. JMSA002]|uniref:IS3 family transposase n=1 Tax=Microbulbifer sp. JMSA002 TaxID=3243368 RepID=UPI00403987E1